MQTNVETPSKEGATGLDQTKSWIRLKSKSKLRSRSKLKSRYTLKCRSKLIV